MIKSNLQKLKSRELTRKEPTTLVRKIQSSLPEQYIYYYLNKQSFDVIRGATFDWLGRSSLDLYLPEFSLAIEYDGSFWHKHEFDSYKTEICLKYGIRMIRIREDATPIVDQSVLIILYKQKKDYSNIAIPIFKIIDFLNKSYSLSIEYPDINIHRDKEKIREFIEEQVNKKSLAYKWPEIYEYWDYEKNVGRPEDVTKSTNLFFWLKCPHCGNSYEMKPRYYNRSMLNCNCEYTVNAYKSYYLYLKDYYNKNGNIESKERSLLARRALDWIDTMMKYQIYNLPFEEVLALQEIDLQYRYDENSKYITPLLRERTEEEQQKYKTYQRK